AVPGESLDKVYQRLYDPKDHAGKRAVVVGGGDSALETAIALTLAGAEVTLSYRNPEFARPKPDNVAKLQQLVADPDAEVQVEAPASERVNPALTANMPQTVGAHHGTLRLMMPSKIKEVRPEVVVLSNSKGQDTALANDVV